LTNLWAEIGDDAAVNDYLARNHFFILGPTRGPLVAHMGPKKKTLRQTTTVGLTNYSLTCSMTSATPTSKYEHNLSMISVLVL
jgi:hypothetical protein